MKGYGKMIINEGEIRVLGGAFTQTLKKIVVYITSSIQELYAGLESQLMLRFIIIHLYCSVKSEA